MTRLLLQTPCVISTSPSSSSASSYSIYSSFHLFPLLPFLLLFLFLPFGVADRQTQGGADGHDASRIQWQGQRVTLAIMRAGHPQHKSLLNIKNRLNKVLVQNGLSSDLGCAWPARMFDRVTRALCSESCCPAVIVTVSASLYLSVCYTKL